jgi:hypothetical protein
VRRRGFFGALTALVVGAKQIAAAQPVLAPEPVPAPVPSPVFDHRDELYDNRHGFMLCTTGAFDTEWSYHQPLDVRVICGYCGRRAASSDGNCDGCGAPLNVRQVKPL